MCGVALVLVVVFLPLCKKENNGDDERTDLRERHGYPHAVKLEEYRQNEHRGKLEHQSTQERNRRRYRTVVQRRKERRAPDVESGKQECEREQSECVHRHIEKLLVISDENSREDGRQKLCDDNHDNSGGEHRLNALGAHVLQFGVILRAVVVADDRGSAYRISDVYRREYELYVHQHAVRGNSVFACESEELMVIQHTYDRR